METKILRELDIPEETIKKLQELKTQFNSFGEEERGKFMQFLQQDSQPASLLKIKENPVIVLLGDGESNNVS